MTRDDRGRVLLVRQRGGAFKGAWLLPGGGLEAGETFDDAVKRETHEETGLVVGDVEPICGYDVVIDGWPRMDVRMFQGRATGDARVGTDGEAVAWTDVDPLDGHPVLLRELKDAGVIAIADSEIDRRMAALGIRMTRIG